MAQDSPIAIDGDSGFIGFASRLNPLNLQPGVLQDSVNMRFDRGVAKVRKGAKRLGENISPSGTPLTLPFILAAAPNEPVIRSSYTGGIFASAVMRSPDGVNSMEVLVIAGSDRAFPILAQGDFTSGVWSDGYLATDTGESISYEGELPIVISILPGELTFPSGSSIEATDTVTMLQAYDRLYLFCEADPTIAGWEEKSLSAGGITVSTTTATVNCTAHGYISGQRIRLEGSTTAAFNGHEFDIVATAADSFTITVPAGTANDATISGRTVRRVKPPIYWDGLPTTNFVKSPAGIPSGGPTYRTMRSVGWASYINNRLVIPDGRDSVSLSDVLDPNNYDPFWQNFRANQGSNDYLVAVHPWVEGSALVFMRRSIYLAEINQSFDIFDTGATLISKLTLLTDEVGCSARRSIVTAGNFVYFLSDSGIYRLDTKLDLKLRGDTKPLSDPIADQFANLNAALAKNSVGLWFDNRYLLACPIDTPTAPTTTNNTVFIYNSLNESWETRDIYGFGVDNFLVATYGTTRRAFITNRVGSLFLLDEIEAGDEAAQAGAGTTPVEATIRTRRYNFGSPHSKRFLRSLADVVLPESSSLSASAVIINPDSTFQVATLSNSTGTPEDYSLKFPIRTKAHALELTFTSTTGRPEIRSVAAEAAMGRLPHTETRTVS
jgi:hypothetical protein